MATDTYKQADDTIYLGLCMAGAISAGAYTAGVMDYLLETLDEWEKRRKEDPQHTPSHRVVIPVIGGASAGGMTSIITAAAINNPLRPVRNLHGYLLEEHPENKFYHSWVDMTGKDMFPLMLDTRDITKGKVYSLFNSAFIEEIAARALKVDQASWVNRPYIDEKLRVFVTLSNLEGFSYNLALQAGNAPAGKYIIKKHGDYACFILSNQGEKLSYRHDGWIPLCFREETNLDIAISAAMATGAFPIGLRSRKVSRLKYYIKDMIWAQFGGVAYDPIHDPYDTLNVDGGLINNEPFERVYELLQERSREKLSAHAGKASCEEAAQDEDISHFRSTVLMIDPFPSREEVFTPNERLFGVMGSTFSAMIGQLRIKPEQVVKAFDPAYGSHFLIAPKRSIPVRQQDGTIVEEDRHGAEAIACGSLDGFGGFLHKEFRIHDYFLGRANCEWFLRNHFTIPTDRKHPVLEAGYGHIADRHKFTGTHGLQIIPVFSEKKDGYYMPAFSLGSNWPYRLDREIQRFQPYIRKRAGKLIMNIAELNRFDQLLLWLGKEVFLRRKLSRLSLDFIEKSLRKHHLMQ